MLLLRQRLVEEAGGYLPHRPQAFTVTKSQRRQPAHDAGPGREENAALLARREQLARALLSILNQHRPDRTDASSPSPSDDGGASDASEPSASGASEPPAPSSAHWVRVAVETLSSRRRRPRRTAQTQTVASGEDADSDSDPGSVHEPPHVRDTDTQASTSGV